MIRNNVHAEHKCTICGYHYNCHQFKSGYICEDCLHWFKEEDQPGQLKK